MLLKSLTRATSVALTSALIAAACSGGDEKLSIPVGGELDAGPGGGEQDQSAGGNDASGQADTTMTGECAIDADCTAKIPTLTPADCAKAVCDTLLKKCHLVAKDKDGDGHAAKNCSASLGTVETGDDCDDADPATYPGAWDGPPTDFDSGPEAQSDRCDQVDNDCNGSPDDGKIPGDAGLHTCKCDPMKPVACYEYSNGLPIDPSTLDMNNQPKGFCRQGTRSCPNGIPGNCIGAVGPELEQCDTLDHDCDGVSGYAGDDVLTAPIWYLDNDHDDYGDPNTPGKKQCSAPGPNWKNQIPNTDCDDTKATRKPGLAETCDGLDNNCNNQVDENVKIHFCKDGDKDGYCTALCTDACQPPTGYILANVCLAGTDCNDADFNVKPGATEQCNGKDDNCNVTVDEGANVQKEWCVDVDKDGYCTSTCTLGCAAPDSTYREKGTCTSVGSDCDDTKDSVHPGATEVCNGVDDNCAGGIDEAPGAPTSWCKDQDTDGYCTASCVTACAAPDATYRAAGSCTSIGQDCADDDFSRKPSAPEVCNGIDDNCANGADEGWNINAACVVGSAGVCKRNGTTQCATTASTWCSPGAGTSGGSLGEFSASTDPLIYTGSNSSSYIAKWDWDCNGAIEHRPSGFGFGGYNFITGSAATKLCNGDYQGACASQGSSSTCKSVAYPCGTNCGGSYCTPAQSCGKTMTVAYCLWQYQNSNSCDSYDNATKQMACK